MPRNTCGWLAALLLWVAPLAAPAQDLNLIVTLDRADLQRRVARLFPIVRVADPLRVRLYHPQVILHEHSDRIGLRLRLDAEVAPQFAVSGLAAVDGMLRFAAASGKFYLDQARVEELQIDGVPAVYLTQFRQLADGVLSDLLRDQAIYTLGQSGEARRIMGSEIKSIHVRDGKLLVELAMP